MQKEVMLYKVLEKKAPNVLLKYTYGFLKKCIVPLGCHYKNIDATSSSFKITNCDVTNVELKEKE